MDSPELMTSPAGAAAPRTDALATRGGRWRRAAAIVLAVGGVITGSACGAASTPANPDLTVPETVTLLTATAPIGTYLTNDAGRALYMWDADRGGQSTCYDDCAVEWPPLLVADHAIAGAGVSEDLIGETTRKDGTSQITYGGWPLYYFEPDVNPGDLSGQGDTGFGAVWWVVTPEGKPLPSAG